MVTKLKLSTAYTLQDFTAVVLKLASCIHLVIIGSYLHVRALACTDERARGISIGVVNKRGQTKAPSIVFIALIEPHICLFVTIVIALVTC
jgi:hypothetical protein